MKSTTQSEHNTHDREPSEPDAPHHHTVVKLCPNCGHHSLIARGQLLVCRHCEQTTWRSES